MKSNITVGQGLAVLGLVCAGFTGSARAATIVQFDTIADGRVQSSGVLGQTLLTGEQNIHTGRSGGSNISDGLFEFDLSSLPAGATVTGAVLQFRTDSLISNTSSTASVSFLGFTGNGVLEVTDESAAATQINLTDFAAGVGGVANNTNLALTLSDLAPINAVLNDADTNDFFTVRSETVNFVTFNVDSLESTDVGALPASLLITYVPEPATAGLFALIPALLGRRRRR